MATFVMLIPRSKSPRTKRFFGGNPAGVSLLTEWLPDAQLQAIAAENNLAGTAVLIGWFFRQLPSIQPLRSARGAEEEPETHCSRPQPS